jgi:hypothetical protein
MHIAGMLRWSRMGMEQAYCRHTEMVKDGHGASIFKPPKKWAWCRHIDVVKNETKVRSKVEKYIKKREALEDLADKWITTLRKSKHPKRKTVKVNPKDKATGVMTKLGKGSQMDEMEYKIEELEQLYRDANEEADKARGLVRYLIPVQSTIGAVFCATSFCVRCHPLCSAHFVAIKSIASCCARPECVGTAVNGFR